MQKRKENSKMKKRVISAICMLSLLFTNTPYMSINAQTTVQTPIEINNDYPLRLQYDEEAPYINENAATFSK